MSIALYQFRLYWDGRQGAARNGRKTCALHQAPVLPGAEQIRLAEIDYAPEVNLAQLREQGSGWREMTGAEIFGADALLARVAESSPTYAKAA